MLSSYADCPRRAIARQFKYEVEKAGYALRQTLPSIGAAVGTATHHVIDNFFKAKLVTSEFTLEDAVEQAVIELKTELQHGCEYDQSTPSVDVARQQINRMAMAYLNNPEISNLIPLAVEHRVTVDLDDVWQITGQIDLVTAHPTGGSHLRDLKTGGVSRSHFQQLGCYSLLLRSDPPPNVPAEIAAVTVDFIKRTPKTRPQDEVVSNAYPASLCEQAAFAVINHIKRDWEEFKQTSDPDVIPVNFMSMMCVERYCLAYGTDWCPLSKEVKK